MASEAAPTFLSLPTELRNHIYLLVFTPEPDHAPNYSERPDALATALNLKYRNLTSESNRCARHDLQVLQTCHQVHSEAHVLALSLTGFHVSGESCQPDDFSNLTSHIRHTKISALRRITITARVSHLRALNEAWSGYPFGNAALKLDTLTIVPKKPDASHSCYAEVADLSQSHTLAYIFAETLKRLRNVRILHVKNQGCFNAVVWKLVYRSFVYRMWRWGGSRCGVRFECSGEDEKAGEEWFTVWLEGDGGNEVGDEVVRMVGSGGDLPDPNLPGF